LTGAPSNLQATTWYLEQLEAMIPRGDSRASASHPKVAATLERVVNIWGSGQKVIVFCHYVATGKVLRQRLSEAIAQKINLLGALNLGCDHSEVPSELDRLGDRFFDRDSPIRRACDAEVLKLLVQFSELKAHHEDLIESVRRYVRTPSFLVRFFPLGKGSLSEADMTAALNKRDQSGLTLRNLLHQFFEFLAYRCGEKERQRYIEAVRNTQTGRHFGEDITQSFAEDELQGDQPERLLPNIRLVNGSTGAATRQRLMYTFNTPFYPEVLIASSVMAEGVDLHLNCRHVIHHDLCWNPSNLEQRTGRVDRIGAMVERCGQSIHVYVPYVAETQDEKMYRVVLDRERWFNVVMGEKYQVDLRNTDILANRIPFPESAARELAFRLEVNYPGSPTLPSYSTAALNCEGRIS
jgi:ERCC4-related helicase